VSENRFAAAFLVPGGLWLLLLFVVPLGFVLAISFGHTDDLGEAIYGTSLDNYERVFDPDFLPVLFRSVGFALATVVLCLLIGYPVAYTSRYSAAAGRPCCSCWWCCRSSSTT
jgi:spermidine/putrescine transport system permease protein